MKRSTLRELHRKADLAIRLGATEYAGDLCEHVLQTFPNDLRTRTLLGQAYLDQSKLDQAGRQFELVLELDPENVPALSAAGVTHSAAGQLNLAVRAFERAYELNPGNTQVRDSLLRLYSQLDGNVSALDPAPPVAVVRWQLRHGDLETALDSVNQLLMTRPGDVYVMLAQAEASWRAGWREAADRLCRQLLARYPRCLKPRFILGEILSADPARESEGVELLHGALVDDPAGLIAAALFHETSINLPALAADVFVVVPDHLLVGPSEIDAALDAFPLAGVDEAPGDWRPPGSALGARSTDDERDAPPRDEAPGGPTTLVGVEGESSGDDAARLGVECLLAVSCRGPLVARYGFEGFQRLERRLQTVARELAFIGTRLVIAFVDDPGSMAQHDVAPVWSTDPPEIKRAIDDLDRAVVREGRGIDGILIVGGDDVVPFFRVPNSADDDDSTILSDSLYAVLPDDSAFAPRIPIGRLPDGSGGNLSLLLRQIDTLLDVRQKPPLTDDGSKILQASRAALGAIGIGIASSLAFGYAASSWESVAGQAFSPLAPAPVLRLSPPAEADDFRPQWVAGRRLLYFNLHGASGGGSWYGHSTSSQSACAPRLPVALTVDQLSEVDLSAPVVFTEACHGANILSKSAADSLALRFLNEGATAFIGPTGACYGAAEQPLAGADLLARLFWTNLREGDRVGVALERAKGQFIREAMDAQGYLDGDDQKTLLEFTLYGDPLMPVFQAREDRSYGADEGPIELPVVLCKRASPV
ncbi:MAG TPA: C25 family cysteine peptidase, partial [Chloroflexota bacterium]|nr:C25 family cysteine peptidase [Chloroflexota bacterium]